MKKLLLLCLVLAGCDIAVTVRSEDYRLAEQQCSTNGGVLVIYMKSQGMYVNCKNGATFIDNKKP